MPVKNFLSRCRWRLRQLRFQSYLAYGRYQLATRPFSTALSDSAWVLYGLARSLKPEVAVETGSATGWSACHVALGLRENLSGMLYAIDPHFPTAWNDRVSVETLPLLQANLRACRLARYVTVLRCTSAEAAKDWRRPIDLLFIDGDHSYEGVRADWNFFAPHVRPGGVVAFHDTTWEWHRDDPYYRADMGVPRFVDELRLQGYPVITLDRNCGVSLVQPHRGGLPLLAPSPPARSDIAR